MIKIILESIGVVLSDPYTQAGFCILIGMSIGKKNARKENS